MIVIEKVATKKQTKQFCNFPLQLYKKCPYFVPQFFVDEMKIFDIKNNTTEKYYMEAYLAIDSETKKVVGRVAAILHNQYNSMHEEKRVRFSRIDFIDDERVSKALMEAVETFGRKHGVHAVCGPAGAIDFDREGLLTKSTDLISTFALGYNYLYYQKHLENLGYTQEAVWIEQTAIIKEIDAERFERISNIAMKRNNLRLLEHKNIKHTIETYKYEIFDFVNSNYKDLYGYVPLTHADIDKIAKDFGLALKKEFVIAVLNKENKFVGFALAMPSIAQAMNKIKGKITPFSIFKIIRLLWAINRPKVLENLLIAVDKEYRTQGVAVILMNGLIKSALKKKIIYCESNAQLVTNKEILSVYENIKPTKVRERAAYYKKLV